MSPYRCSADIAGTSNTGQLHGLDAPALDPSTDSYIWAKAVREWSELIAKGAASGGNRVYTGQLATMARQLYRALPQPQQQVLDNAQAQGRVNYKQDDQVAAVEQIIGLLEENHPSSRYNRSPSSLRNLRMPSAPSPVRTLCLARQARRRENL
jgi:hypothetical protein